jgi:hypothetical protein
MTKSRIALLTFLAGVAAWPAAARAQPAAATAEEAIAAYRRWFGEVTEGTGFVRRCRRDAGEDEIVVCGRSDERSMRVPYEPIAGQVHRIAGEMPTGGDAAAADRCLRLCYQPVMVDVGEAARFLGRGLDRILHSD